MIRQELNSLDETLGLEYEKDRYYVYALCTEDRVPFYVGKGSGVRLFAHEKEAENASVYLEMIERDPDATQKDWLRQKKALTAKIKTIIDNKGKILRVIVKWGLTQQEAYMCESTLINLLDFLSEVKKRTSIVELTNKVNGHASAREKDCRAEDKTRARTVDSFLRECAIAERPIEELKGKHIVLININKLYRCCFDDCGKADDNRIKDVVCGLKSMCLCKAQQAEYVFAVYRQRVVGVYHVTRPPQSLSDERKNGFMDFPAFPPDVRSLDLLKACADTLEEAKEKLEPGEYKKLEEALKAEQKSKKKNGKLRTLSQIFKTFQKRIYFVLDSNVPAPVSAYKNCFPTKNGTTDWLRKGRAQFGGPILNY